MQSSLPPAMGRSLDRLRERGLPVSVGELAKQLLSLERPVDPWVARRVVAAALGQPEATLPETLEAGQLRPAREAAVADQPLAEACFAVVDLETTGVAMSRSAIVEIGAVRVEAMEVRDEFQSLVRPPHPVPPRITDLTGIDDAMLADAPPPAAVLPRFRAWLDCRPRAPFVAHNASFDSRFVERALEQSGLPPYAPPVLCTRRLGRRLLPRLGRYNLDTLCAHFGVANAARHRALGDARATARAWVELLQLAREELGATRVGDLLDLQSRPPRRPTRQRGRRRARQPGSASPTRVKVLT